MDSRFEDVDCVPDPSAYEGLETRDLDYDGIQGGEPIGSGGFARVSVVTVDGRELIVKEPVADNTVDTDTVQSFVDEAETWARLDNHAHVVTVVDWGTRFPWIAMEYMDGGSLADRLESGELDTAQAIWTGICLSRALQHAHRHGVAHLDLTPDNVLFRVTDDGTWDLPKIGDWGLSEALLDQSETVEGLTPNYAAPEQFDPEEFGQPDDFTDRFQLAAVVYEALTGEQAFPGSGATAMRRVLAGDVTPPTTVDPELPDELDEIFERALEIRKADRYETVVNFRRDLASVLEGVLETPGEDAESTGVTPGPNEPQDDEMSTADPVERQADVSAGLDRDRPATMYERVEDIADFDTSDAAFLLDNAGFQSAGGDAEPLRLAVDDTFATEGEIRLLVNVVSGTLSPGDNLAFQPSGAELTVDSMEKGLTVTPVETATAGDSVTLVPSTITDGDDIRRGDLGGHPASTPQAVETFQAHLYVLEHPSVLTAGYTPVVHAQTAQVAASITALSRRLTPAEDETWDVDQTPDFAEAGDIVEATLEPQRPFSIDPIDSAPETGWFTVRDAGDLIALGIVTHVEPATSADPVSEPATDELVSRLSDIETEVQEHTQQIGSLFDETTVPATENVPTRLPIQDVYTLSDVGEVLTGDVVTGSLGQDDPVRIQPSDATGSVDTIEQEHEEISRAGPGQTVSFHVDGVEPDDVRRGDVCGPLDAAPPIADTFRARMFVTDPLLETVERAGELDTNVVTAGYTPVVHTHTAQVACTIEEIAATIDPDDGSIVEKQPDFVESGDAAEVVFAPQQQLTVEPVTEIPELGVFTVRDMGQTIGVGGVLEVTEETDE